MLHNLYFQLTYYLFIAFLGFWHGSLIGNIMNLGSNLAGAKNLVLIQSFEALGNGLGGFVGPPVTSRLGVNNFHKASILSQLNKQPWIIFEI